MAEKPDYHARAVKAWDTRGRKAQEGGSAGVVQTKGDWKAATETMIEQKVAAREAKAASSSEVLSYKGLTKDSPEVVAAATKAHEKARAIAAELDTVMLSIEASTGGKLAGFKYRVKSVESIADKAIRDAIADNVHPTEAIARMSDLNRYTLCYDADELVDGFAKAHEALIAAGYAPYDTKHKNYFSPGGAYNGYNTVYSNEEGAVVTMERKGVRFELQFHTPESVTIKEKAHIMYTELRSLPRAPETKQQRQKLWDDMMVLWDTYRRPRGWQNLPGVLVPPEAAA